MSKDLEKEYKALMDSEVPDLWARIESGLDEKPVCSYQKNIDRKKQSIKMWAGLVAACVCIVLSIPVMIRHLLVGGTKSYTTKPNDNIINMECAPMAAEYIAEEAAGDISPAALTDDSNNVVDDTNAALTSGNTEDGLNTVTSDDATMESNVIVSNEASNYYDTSVVEETTEQEGNSFTVTVQILDIDVRRNNGIVYTANVIASEYPVVQPSTEIKIFSAALAAEGVISLEKAETYELTLSDDMLDSKNDVPIYMLQAVQ